MVKMYVLNMLNWLMSAFKHEEGYSNEEFVKEAKKLLQQMWVPPARYCISAAGVDLWVDYYRYGPGGGCIEAFWTKEIGGVEKEVKACIYETNFMIVDYGPTLSPEITHCMLEPGSDLTQAMSVQKDAKVRTHGDHPNNRNVVWSSAYA